MNELKTVSILPGKGIGLLRLGMTFDEIVEQIELYDQRELANATQLICENIKIWIDHQTDCASQILAYGSFEGAFDGWLTLGMTLADAVKKGYSYGVYMYMHDAANQMLGGAGDCFYTAPGVLTFFLQTSYAEDLPERDVRFSVELIPFLDAEGNRIDADSENIVRLEEELKLTSSVTEEKVYVNTEPVIFGEIGVTLDEMQLFVKPQELYVKLYYTVSDTELNRRIYSANTKERDQLALEFIDPSVLSDTPLRQRLSEGPTGHVIRTMLSDEDEMPLRWAEEFTLGVNELKGSYTLRVYDNYTEERYDCAVVTLREATETEIEALRGEK